MAMKRIMDDILGLGIPIEYFAKLVGVSLQIAEEWRDGKREPFSKFQNDITRMEFIYNDGKWNIDTSCVEPWENDNIEVLRIREFIVNQRGKLMPERFVKRIFDEVESEAEDCHILPDEKGKYKLLEYDKDDLGYIGEEARNLFINLSWNERHSLEDDPDCEKITPMTIIVKTFTSRVDVELLGASMVAWYNNLKDFDAINPPQ